MSEFNPYYEEIVAHPFDQAMAEILDAQQRIDAEQSASEAGATEMQSMLDCLEVPEREVLRDAMDCIRFDDPHVDAEAQAGYILSQEMIKITGEDIAKRDPAQNMDPTTIPRSKPSATEYMSQKLRAQWQNPNDPRNRE